MRRTAMQKHHFIFLFLISTILSYSTFAEAALQFLPRYQGSYSGRSQSGGKDKITVSCTSKGGVEKGANQICAGAFSAGGKTCYKSCRCISGYKTNASGGCVAKICSDYSLKSSPDATMSCKQVSKVPNLTCYECVACNSSTYKYACSGGLNSSAQGSANKCGLNYSKCECVANASWNSTSGKCECGSNYKSSGNSCVLKTCTDYNSSYLTSEDKTKSCTKLNPRTGLECWSCSACTGTLYDCGSMANASGGSGTPCGGKYPKCSCKSGYFWDSGKCSLSCTPSSCTGSGSCNGKACTIFRPTAIAKATDLGTGIGAYETCTPKNCSGDSYQYGYLPTGCATGYAGYSIGSCPTPSTTDCSALGYTQTSCPSSAHAVKCPFDHSKIACL